MSNDISQLGLKEAPQVDWANYGSSGSYQVPPPARDPNGEFITYYGITEAKLDENNDEGFLQYLLDPIKLVKGGPGVDGYTIKFTRASVRPYTDFKTKLPKKGNPNKLADFLRACGLTAKPQQNEEYIAAINLTKSKPFPFVIDWEAYNKDTQEKVKGYLNFPADDKNPSLRKAILHAGDVLSLVDNKGVPTGEAYTVKSEVLFANAKLKYFRDPSRGSKS